MAAKTKEILEISIEEKLIALYTLQTVDTEIDKIKILRGELPLEVQDLEDELAGLETRITNFSDEIKGLEKEILLKKNEITDSLALIKKYEDQQNNVRNNREYDSLSKEIEFQTLEIQLCEKKIREFTANVTDKTVIINESQAIFDDRQADLNHKKMELEEIVAETRREEDALSKKSEEVSQIIESRLLTAYSRIRENARNGLAVVAVERDACGGCFNKIPPQRQLDIKSRKKIIVCEYCGRILVDGAINDEIVPVSSN